MAKNTLSVKRVDFIRRLQEAGFDYVEATRAWETIIGLMEDAVVQGGRINLDKLGAIVPQKKPPRTINMGFERKNGSVRTGINKQYAIGRRVKYCFRLYRSFTRTHNLDWI